MDEAVIKYYRKLTSGGFEHFGAIEDASIYVESVSERMSICGVDYGFIELYVAVVGDVIEDIKYRCSCDPTSNVALELLCKLVKNKTLDEVQGLTEQSICRLLGSDAEELKTKCRGLLELLDRGIRRYRSRPHSVGGA